MQANGIGSVTSVTTAVARHVRAFRQARRWSLDELAGRSGVSKGMVVQIEGARTNPSVGTLSRLADAFGIAVARLVEAGTDGAVRITDAGNAPVLWRGGYGGSARLLSGRDGVELWEWRLSAGDRHTCDEHLPGTREVLHVLTGAVTVEVDGADHLVPAGLTIDVPADRAHGLRNEGLAPVRLIKVYTSRASMPTGA